MYFSKNEGRTWDGPFETPASGIVPDKLLELESGRWLLSCHYREPETECLVQRLWYSDNKGVSWEGPVIVGKKANRNLCEASIIPVGDTLIAFMRENSWKGYDCYKSISYDCGGSWSEPVEFPLPGCHRPVTGKLLDGTIMIAYRFMPGGKPKWGCCHNFFIAISDCESVMAEKRDDMYARVIPIDYDESQKSDTGYSGWIQFTDGCIYIVNYIMNGAPAAYIRGYSLSF
jgi:sialidase-1